VTIVEHDIKNYPDVANFLSYLSSRTMMQGALNNVYNLYAKYGQNYLQLAEDMLSAMHKISVNPAQVFEAYIYEYLRDLARFQTTGEYDNGTFDQIREKIYDNAEVMNDTYLPGLFVSYGFTSLLHEKYRFFERAFIPHLTSKMRGVEIGFGDGFYLWSILKHRPDIKVTGLDISQYAIDFTDKLLAASGFTPDCYDLRLGNLCERVPLADASADWCILAEVIEHVADPAFSMKEISRIVKPQGLFFMATVIDSNHMDHITNFDSPDVVTHLLRSSGFIVQDSLYYDVSKELKDLRDRAIGLAYLCRRS
jgi:SAM-dependent methyltransferase